MVNEYMYSMVDKWVFGVRRLAYLELHPKLVSKRVPTLQDVALVFVV
jgi:hypothetical protein